MSPRCRRRSGGRELRDERHQAECRRTREVHRRAALVEPAQRLPLRVPEGGFGWRAAADGRAGVLDVGARVEQRVDEFDVVVARRPMQRCLVVPHAVAWASRSAPASTSTETIAAGLGRWPGASAKRCSGVRELIRLVARPGSAASSVRTDPAAPALRAVANSKARGSCAANAVSCSAPPATQQLADSCRRVCGFFGQWRAEEKHVAIGIDVREFAHFVVGIAQRGPGRRRTREFRAQLVGVLDADVDPGGGAAGVVVRFDREVQLDALSPADGEAGLGGRGIGVGRREGEPEPLVVLDRARHVGRHQARRDAEEAPERDAIGLVVGHRPWSSP